MEKQHFFGKYTILIQSNRVRAVLVIFLVLFSVSVRLEVTVNKNIRFTDSATRIRLADCSKLTEIRKNDNAVTIRRHGVIVNFF